MIKIELYCRVVKLNVVHFYYDVDEVLLLPCFSVLKHRYSGCIVISRINREKHKFGPQFSLFGSM